MASSTTTSPSPAAASPFEVKAKLLERLSTIDKSFLQIEDETQLMTIAGCWIFEECPTEEAIERELHRWVAMFPVFHARLNGDLWEDYKDFDMKEHFCVSTLSGPGGKRELEDYISAVMSRPFDMAKPLWTAHLVKGFNGHGGAYFISLHHCISDGQGAVRMVLSLASSSEEEKVAGAGHTAKAKPKPTMAHHHEGSRGGLRGKLRSGFKTLGPVGQRVFAFLTAIHFVTLLVFALTLADWLLFHLFAMLHFAWKWAYLFTHPKRVFNKPAGVRKQVAYSDLLDLEEVKEVGRATGATLNDVLISNLASTLRRYLQSTGELSLEREISCVVPVSVRKPDDWQLGNKVCLVMLHLPLHISDPLERLRVVKRRLDEMKASHETEISYFGMVIGLRIIPDSVREWLTKIFTRKYHVLLTNVPGPRHQISFGGMPVKEYYSFVPQPSKGGLGVCVLSYNGKVSLSINTDAGHITPAPSSLLKEFREEFEVLKREVERVHPKPAVSTVPAPISPPTSEPTSPTSTCGSDSGRKSPLDSGFNSESE